jgi:diadenylate cyclase
LDELWLRLNDLNKGWSFIDWRALIPLAFQLVIIGYAVIWTWSRIKGTQAERLVKGIVVLTSICLLSWVFRLTLITWILQQLIPITVVTLVIIFQPEIRRGLGYLGRTTFRVDFSLTDRQKQRATETIAQLVAAVRELSRERTGALIVIEPPEGEHDYLSPGTTINGHVSSNLLLSIFQPKSPLHDGAVVIRTDKIIAAGVILPITDNPKLSFKYGTRHRAAIGLSEIYDGLCIVVSEETGAISAANRGMLVRYNNADDLRDPLSYFYSDTPAETKTGGGPLQSFFQLFGLRPQPASDTTSGAAVDAQLSEIARLSSTVDETPDEAEAALPLPEPEAPFIEEVRHIEAQPGSPKD